MVLLRLAGGSATQFTKLPCLFDVLISNTREYVRMARLVREPQSPHRGTDARLWKQERQHLPRRNRPPDHADAVDGFGYGILWFEKLERASLQPILVSPNRRFPGRRGAICQVRAPDFQKRQKDCTSMSARSCTKLHEVARSCTKLHEVARSCTKLHEVTRSYTKLVHGNPGAKSYGHSF